MERPQTPWHDKLKGRIDATLLYLRDNRGQFLLDKLNEEVLKRFVGGIFGYPWDHHLLLGMMVYGSRKAEPETIRTLLNATHPRFKDIFQAYDLQTMDDFQVETHMYGYLTGEVYPEHSYNMRSNLYKRYNGFVRTVERWVDTFCDVTTQNQLHNFMFAPLPWESRGFSFNRLAKEQAQQTRKDETDAIVPYLSQIRAEGNFRYNQAQRVREQFRQKVKEVLEKDLQLPLEFSYAEPKRVGERFFFRLWDKPSFVLAHPEYFSSATLQAAQQRKGTYQDENNQYFLEFLRAERSDGEEAEGLWFSELFQQGLIGIWSQNTSEEEKQKKTSLLKAWGYGDENNDLLPRPFHSQHAGILNSSTFIALHQNKAEGVLLDVEPLYAAATFGLVALDMFTTTGARLNELLQISNTRECIQAKKMGGQMRYSFRAIPKGRDELEEFYIAKQTVELLKTLQRMLKEHYNGNIPHVLYRHEQRKHLFPNPQPYYFQYHGKALGKHAIWASLRFLLHGLHFETREGEPVIVKTHLLRHAFATEAVQRQKMPLDIVTKLLHHRDISTTMYYSAPTPSQVSEAVGELHDVISDYVDVDELVLRSPEELQREFEEHQSKVGVFNRVIGGTCVTDFVCPTKMACVGCKAKIPNPEQEGELHELVALTYDMEKRFEAMGLDLEVKKARRMRREAKQELEEIFSIKEYLKEREDGEKLRQQYE